MATNNLSSLIWSVVDLLRGDYKQSGYGKVILPFTVLRRLDWVLEATKSIFYKRLLPLLEFGREREGIDLSKVVLTHHHLKDQGSRTLPLTDGETPKLAPITEAGSGRARAAEGLYG